MAAFTTLCDKLETKYGESPQAVLAAEKAAEKAATTAAAVTHAEEDVFEEQVSTLQAFYKKHDASKTADAVRAIVVKRKGAAACMPG